MDVALLKARKYCAFTERTKLDVSKKLHDYGVPEADIPILIEKLEQEGFLNETRFVSAFASGKFRYNKWGRNRIINEMKRKGLPEELIHKGIAELSPEDYLNTLDKLLTKKWKQLQSKIIEDDYDSLSAAKQKLITYALQKGYEHDIIIQRMKRLIT